jgi:hypothetical protein
LILLADELGGWPPDYVQVFKWRQQKLFSMRRDRVLEVGAKEYYRTCPAEFIDHWCDTYDPRNLPLGLPARVPFVLFPRQVQLIEFFHECLKAEECGLVEKSRDMGATWLASGFSVWLWLFWPGAAIGWGSYKEQLVDRIGVVDSIFEKMRMIVRGLPDEFLPRGFSPSEHMNYMRFVNPENGSTITGEVGDNMGRGGRKMIYFKDEAQPLDAKVLTPQGWKLMADMAVGVDVIGADGKPTRVVGINDCGVHDVYRVTFSDGTFTECSPNHLWTVQKAWGKKEQLTLSTSEIADSLMYVSPGGQTQYKYRVPVVCAPVEFDSVEKELPLDPYLVGALLGDGSVKYVPSHSPKITTADAEIVESFKRLLPAGCLLNFEKTYQYRIVDERGRQGYYVKSRARLAVVAAGIAGMGSYTKQVPDRYKFASVNVRLALLQGLMDTDGSACAGYAEFCTTSPKLADDVLFLAQSLGGTATHNIKIDPRGYRDVHVLHLTLPKEMVPFRLTRKLSKLRPRSHPPGRTILSIALVGQRPVRCISVEAKDGLYLTDNCIVTHNSAHYEHPELIEAALTDNTRVQIDLSSVHGLGTVFHRKREAGVDWEPGQKIAKGRTNVFVMDWSDHPAKTQAWHDERERSARDNGLMHVFAQEVDRNYAASVEGVIIKPEWVTAAIDAHLKLSVEQSGMWVAALDVADEGLDTNALAKRKGCVLKGLEEWGDRDVGASARRAIAACRDVGSISLQYDCVGVGAGVKSEGNRLIEEKLMPKGVTLVPWSAAAKVKDEDQRVIVGDSNSPLNKDYFYNYKAQAWVHLARRFENTYRALNEKGFTWKADELISLPSDLPLLRKLQKELSQATASTDNARMKLVVEKAPDGSKSPNLADAVVMAFFPVLPAYDSSMDWLGTPTVTERQKARMSA